MTPFRFNLQRSRRTLRVLLLRRTPTLLLSVCGACTQPADSTLMTAPDRALFAAIVYPILMRDCAFSQCHGATRRPFQLYGPGRSRLSEDHAQPGLKDQELERSYERTVSMLFVTPGTAITQAPLFMKPLAMSAGGASHRGLDQFGRDAFLSSQDPRYVQILSWALSTPAPTPVAPDADGPTAGLVAP